MYRQHLRRVAKHLKLAYVANVEKYSIPSLMGICVLEGVEDSSTEIMVRAISGLRFLAAREHINTEHWLMLLPDLLSTTRIMINPTIVWRILR